LDTTKMFCITADMIMYRPMYDQPTDDWPYLIVLCHAVAITVTTFVFVTLYSLHTYIQLKFDNVSLTEQSPATHYNKNREKQRKSENNKVKVKW